MASLQNRPQKSPSPSLSRATPRSPPAAALDAAAPVLPPRIQAHTGIRRRCCLYFLTENRVPKLTAAPTVRAVRRRIPLEPELSAPASPAAVAGSVRPGLSSRRCRRSPPPHPLQPSPPPEPSAQPRSSARPSREARARAQQAMDDAPGCRPRSGSQSRCTLFLFTTSTDLILRSTGETSFIVACSSTSSRCPRPVPDFVAAYGEVSRSPPPATGK